MSSSFARRGAVRLGLLRVGGSGRACGSWVASYASPARTDAQQGNARNKCLPSASLLALFKDPYLVANVNRSGHERGPADGENRFALVNHHVRSLLYLS